MTISLPPLEKGRLFSDAPFTYISYRNGRRWVLFAPYVVLKAARGSQRVHLAQEARGTRAASRLDFWADLVPPGLALGGRVLARRRYAKVEQDDHAAVAALTRRMLARALAMPRVSVDRLSSRLPLYRDLPPEHGRHAEGTFTGMTLPLTAIHGDMHFFNFARRGDGRFVLLDWEHFMEAGSFVFDYLEFHVSARCFSAGTGWHDFLAAFDPSDRLVTSLARRVRVEPSALWAFYLVTKLNMLCQRKGGLPRLTRARRRETLDILLAAFARASRPMR
jgi:hypothetical protein